jgi:hypothetical protein
MKVEWKFWKCNFDVARVNDKVIFPFEKYKLLKFTILTTGTLHFVAVFYSYDEFDLSSRSCLSSQGIQFAVWDYSSQKHTKKRSFFVDFNIN